MENIIIPKRHIARGIKGDLRDVFRFRTEKLDDQFLHYQVSVFVKMYDTINSIDKNVINCIFDKIIKNEIEQYRFYQLIHYNEFDIEVIRNIWDLIIIPNRHKLKQLFSKYLLKKGYGIENYALILSYYVSVHAKAVLDYQRGVYY